MEFLNLFWNFNADSKTKLFFFAIVGLAVLCILCRPKGSDKSNQVKTVDKINNVMSGKNWEKKDTPLTQCQIDHKLCQENLKLGNSNQVCHVCKPNGDYPEQIYHPNVGLIKVNPKTGKPI